MKLATPPPPVAGIRHLAAFAQSCICPEVPPREEQADAVLFHRQLRKDLRGRFTLLLKRGHGRQTPAPPNIASCPKAG